MKNERNAGAKPKWKQGVEVVRFQRRLPKDKITEIEESINEICKEHLTPKKKL